MPPILGNTTTTGENTAAPLTGAEWIRGVQSGDNVKMTTQAIADLGYQSPLTTKGDLAASNGSNDTRLPVGANGAQLTADSTQPLGVKWYDGIGAFALTLLANTGAAAVVSLQGSPGSVSRTVQSALRDEVSVKAFGAMGDGTSHALSTVTALGNTNTTGWTLSQWQTFWPHVTSLTNQLDWAAAQAAVNTGKCVKWPDGSYLHDQTLTSSTYNQRLYGNGRLAGITFTLASTGFGILLSGSSGRQQVMGLNLVGSTNCTKVIDYTSPQIQVFFNWITAGAAGSIGVNGEDENTGAGKYCFGAQICYNFIHGSFTTGSRGVRFGLNSQTSLLFSNTIDNFETGLAIENSTDSIAIEKNVFEALMSTGHGIDMRGTAGSPTYKNVRICGTNHFEDVYSAVCWGTNGASGSTYTSCEIAGNTFNGHAGGTTHFLTVSGTCGAGCANNRVEYNDATDASGATTVTSFFNLNDVNGAASIIARKGNTVAVGAWATGSAAIYAYSVRTLNAIFGNYISSGAIEPGSSEARIECKNGSYDIPMRWASGEYLESVQFVFLPVGSTPQVSATILSISDDTIATVTSLGAQTGTNGVKSTITLPVNTVSVQGFDYALRISHALGGGTTAYSYIPKMLIRA